MKTLKKFLPILLSIMMVIAAIPVVTYAENTESNVLISAKAETVNVGDEVVVYVGNAEMTVASVAFGFDFDTEYLEVTSITQKPKLSYTYYDEDEEDYVDDTVNATSVSTTEEANASGHIGVVFTNSIEETYNEKEKVLTVKMIAKKAGTVDLITFEDSAGTNGFKGEGDILTITIVGETETEPTCTHDGEKWYFVDEDNYHNVVCDDCDEFIEERVPCEDKANDGDHLCDICYVNTVTEHSGGAADCTNQAKCEECGEPYGEVDPTKHDYLYACDKVCYLCQEETRPDAKHSYEYACDQECSLCGQNTNPDARHDDENYDHYCDYCNFKMNDCVNENDDHQCDFPGCGKTLSSCEGELVYGKSASCTEDGWEDYYKCFCGKYYEDEDCTKEIKELLAWQTGDGLIKGGHKWSDPDYDDNGDGTHTAHYTCNNQCGESKSDPAEEHKYVNGVCICGAKLVTFTVTIEDIIGDIITTLELEAGTNLLEALSAVTVPNVYYGFEKFEFEGIWGFEGSQIGTDDVMPERDILISPEYWSTGWATDDSTHWYFEIRDVPQTTGWTKIDRASYLENGEGYDWYYLDPTTGYRAEGIARVPYNTALGYTADAESIAYAQSKGMAFIDKDTGLFVFDDKGVFQQNTSGLTSYEGETRYIRNGLIEWHPGLVVVDGEAYYFIGDSAVGGNKPAEGDIYITRNNGSTAFAKDSIYNFADGKPSGLNGIVDGMYYDNSRLACGEGLVKLAEGYIYVRSNGNLAIGQYWVTKTNGLVSAGMYNFGDDGFLVSTKDPSVNGIVDGYYYKNGEPYYAGLIEIDGNTYYVKSNGQLATGKYYITKVSEYTGALDAKTGDKFTFGEDGALVG